jgi:hypothetical protein
MALLITCRELEGGISRSGIINKPQHVVHVDGLTMELWFQTKPMTVISAGIIWLLATLLALPDAICSRLAEVYLEAT